MADDRMKNDDLQRNMGTKGEEDFGHKTPGRNPQGGQQGEQQGGQHAGGQIGGGQQGGQKQPRNFEDDDLGAGKAGQNDEQIRGGKDF